MWGEDICTMWGCEGSCSNYLNSPSLIICHSTVLISAGTFTLKLQDSSEFSSHHQHLPPSCRQYFYQVNIEALMDTRRLQASTQYQPVELCIVAIKLYFSSSSGNRFVLFMPAYYDLYIDIIRIVRVKLFQSFRHLFYNLFIYPLTVERKFVCKSRHYQYSIMKSKPYSMLHFQKKTFLW